MKQDHTEETIDHTEGQQNTGNHKVPGAPDHKGADTKGGTRAGAQNVEPTGTVSVQSGPDVERAAPPDSGPTADLTDQKGPHAERAPERDERGRL